MSVRFQHYTKRVITMTLERKFMLTNQARTEIVISILALLLLAGKNNPQLML
ncbi:hypothetical protein [Halalkalibacter okhensis]|uniref:hypothetical protein n=1 Tax=Halalkalibacter okhensis TaxID=333138 RepID=UPI000AD7B3AB|nr:hypothetical protein [Halalkalibacter okhensis]